MALIEARKPARYKPDRAKPNSILKLKENKGIKAETQKVGKINILIKVKDTRAIPELRRLRNPEQSSTQLLPTSNPNLRNGKGKSFLKCEDLSCVVMCVLG